MFIGNVNVVESKKIQKREERTKKEKIKISRSTPTHSTHEVCNETMLDISDSSTEEYNNLPSTSKGTDGLQTTGQNRIELPTFAQLCDRYRLSDRSAAAIASAVLKDVGIISEEDKMNVVDRSKVRRARVKSRQRFQDNNEVYQSSLL
ncbi:hypothetical protein RN001_006770 [Aquatica leii]|uniref:Uncharacterized protein n=1 Tax=Aquatica leii TaxID=1421715 RepID=A0AAN7PJ11_9COLE|nr:hypothetical protein RN001_006770 [Aquatica leii]